MALTFNGSTQYLSRASGIVANGPIAISALFKHPNSAADHTIFQTKENATVDNYHMLCPDTLERRIWQVRSVAANVVMVGSNGEGGGDIWHHQLCWSNSSTDHGSILDGDPSTLISSTTSSAPNGFDETSIAASTTGGNLFDGELAEVAVWNVAITGQEAAMAQALCKGFSPAFFRRGLVAYLPMIRDTRDLCGNTWTENGGAPAVFDHPRMIYPVSGWARRFTTAAAGGASIIPLVVHHRKQQAAA